MPVLANSLQGLRITASAWPVIARAVQALDKAVCYFAIFTISRLMNASGSTDSIQCFWEF